LKSSPRANNLNLALPLWNETPEPASRDIAETFRRLYYHLYTNSNSSRAERIVQDISLLLLLKLASETNGIARDLADFRDGNGGANDLLLLKLRTKFPDLVDEHERFTLDDAALRRALDELDKIDLSSAPAHVLGEAFQALIGPRLRGDKGQFFTPKALVRVMVRVVDPKPEESILDPACGTGGFLMECHSYQVAAAGKKQPTGGLVGIDKDADLARLGGALLRITTQSRALVGNLNSLDERAWLKWIPHVDHKFDVVLTNPPFGARIGVQEPEILRQFDLGHRWVDRGGEAGWQQTTAIVTSQDPQLLFLELCVRRLKPGGRLGIVLPEGVFGNKGQGYVWSWLIKRGRILALLDCPRTTFQPSTDTKTNVLFFERSIDEPSRLEFSTYPVRIAVALHCGHDRRGRAFLPDGREFPNDFGQLGDSLRSPLPNDSEWHEVHIKDRGYLVPRYYIEERPQTPQEAELTRGAKTATLDELVAAKLLAIRKGDEVGSDTYGTGAIPFVRTSDVSNFEISADPTNAVSQQVYLQFAKRQQLKAGDVLVVVDGRYRIGATAILTENNFRCVVQSHFRILGTPKPHLLDPYELLFALNLPSVRLRVRNLVFVQSTLGTLGKRLLELRIPILHGEGPWQERVERFRAVLQARDRLLAEIAAMNTADYEL